MSHDEFRDLVASLREAQKAYFLRRSDARRLACKRLEKLVDQAIAASNRPSEKRGTCGSIRPIDPQTPKQAASVAESTDAR